MIMMTMTKKNKYALLVQGNGEAQYTVIHHIAIGEKTIPSALIFFLGQTALGKDKSFGSNFLPQQYGVRQYISPQSTTAVHACALCDAV